MQRQALWGPKAQGHAKGSRGPVHTHLAERKASLCRGHCKVKKMSNEEGKEGGTKKEGSSEGREGEREGGRKGGRVKGGRASFTLLSRSREKCGLRT